MSQRKTGVILSYTNIFIKNLVVLLYTPFLLKFLGQSQYGLYQMANSLITTLSLLSMGMGIAYVRFYTKAKSEKDSQGISKLNGMYLIIFSCISIISLLIGLALSINTETIFSQGLTVKEIKIMRNLIILMSINVSLTFISSVFDSNIIVHEQFRFQQSRQIMQTVFVPLFTIPLVILGMGPVAITISQTLITLLFLILNARYSILKLNMQFVFSNLDFNLLKQILVFSFFVFLTQIVDIITNQAPSIILGIYTNSSFVATYSVALQLKNMFILVTGTLMSVFLPHVNELVANGAKSRELTNLMLKIGRLQFLMMSFLLGGFIVVGKYFIQVWSGIENTNAYYLLILMIFPALVPMSQNIGVVIQQAQNRHKFRSITYLVCALINLTITIYAVMNYGLIGSVVGFVVYTILGNLIIMNWYYNEKMNLNMKFFWLKLSSLFLPFTIGVFFSYILTILMPINSILLFCFYCILYSLIFITVYVVFSKTSEEKEMITSIMQKIKNFNWFNKYKL